MSAFPIPIPFADVPDGARFRMEGWSASCFKLDQHTARAIGGGSFHVGPETVCSDITTAAEMEAEYAARLAAERKAEAERFAAFHATVAAVAKVLSGRMTMVAKVDKREGAAERYASISMANGKRLSLCLATVNRSDRIEIRGELPRRPSENYARSAGSITVAADKPAHNIASDIIRRLWPDYVAAFDKASAENAKANKYAADRDALARALVEASDGATWNATHSGGVHAGGRHWDAEVWDDSASFTIRSVPAKAAIALVKALARIRPASEE